MASRWPKDNQAALIRFYGDPGKGEPGAQLVKVTPPFKLYYDGKLVKTLSFHKKAAGALESALQKIWDYYGHDQAKIDALEISKYSGAYNHRLIRGSKTKWSNHAYGAAIDLDAEDNGFGTGRGDLPWPVIAAFKSEGARWGGDYKGRTDPMHFEFCDGGEPQRTFEQWLDHYGVKRSTAAKTVTVDSPDELEDVEMSSQSREPTTLQIETVQRSLKELGYHSVGGIDGKWGGMTAGAVAAFKLDRKLSGDPVIDNALILELAKAKEEGWQRPIAKERADATTDVVASKVPAVGEAKTAVEASKSSKIMAWILGIPSAVVAFVKGVVDNFEEALTSPALGAVKEFFADNVLYVALGIVGIAAAIWYKSSQAEVSAEAAKDSTVEAFREGKIS